MGTLDDASNRTVQMNRIYQALGRFVVEFSRVVLAMETGVQFVINGDQQLVSTLTVEMTADPLARAWRSAMTQAIDLSDEDNEVLAGLANEVRTLTNLRNDWAHGTWFVGYGNEETTDWSKAGLMRFKNSAKGVGRSTKLESEPTAEYIDRAATHASLVADAVNTFGLIVTMRRLGSLGENTHPSDRVRIVKEGGRRHIKVTQDGSNWRSSEWT